MAISVCHFTSVHPAEDVRIFLKECTSLARAGFRTMLVATDCQNREVNGVTIHRVPKSRGGRFWRMFLTAFRVFKVARSLDADIYHFHDPELLPYGVLLCWAGKVVIYDVHENVAEDIKTKDWIPLYIRGGIARLFYLFENWAAKKLTYVVAATPSIRERFLRAGIPSIDINNYPILGELSTIGAMNRRDSKYVCFVGCINERRGAVEMVKAIGLTDCALCLAGDPPAPMLQLVLEEEAGWGRVVHHGHLSRTEVSDLLSKCFAGLVVFHPGPNHTDSQPNKLFEYMSAGLPVIASDFPGWRDIVMGRDCGLCVDPMDPEAIAGAITWLAGHPEEVHRLGENGKKAVAETYNWEAESAKLTTIYKELASDVRNHRNRFAL